MNERITKPPQPWIPQEPEHLMFKPLGSVEVEEFRRYARDHDPDLDAWEAYHPVCREEWERLGKGPGSPPAEVEDEPRRKHAGMYL